MSAPRRGSPRGPPTKKLLPQIVRRGSRGAKRALAPPYKILDPPMPPPPKEMVSIRSTLNLTYHASSSHDSWRRRSWISTFHDPMANHHLHGLSPCSQMERQSRTLFVLSTCLPFHRSFQLLIMLHSFPCNVQRILLVFFRMLYIVSCCMEHACSF